MNNIKTLLFCTSFFDNKNVLDKRYKKWLDYYNNSNLIFDQCLIIDDGSPIIPKWNDISIITKENNLDIQPNNKTIFVHFDNNLGRLNVRNYPGWYRSFKFAAKYAKKFNFEKIIHIESDAYIISDKCFNVINTLHEGWNTFWCSEHNFPESSIQIIGKDKINSFHNFTNQNYEKFIDNSIECFIPFTNIIKNLKGGRYGENYKTLPDNIDFCCQFLEEWSI
jgi:hypothetical protein